MSSDSEWEKELRRRRCNYAYALAAPPPPPPTTAASTNADGDDSNSNNKNESTTAHGGGSSSSNATAKAIVTTDVTSLKEKQQALAKVSKMSSKVRGVMNRASNITTEAAKSKAKAASDVASKAIATLQQAAASVGEHIINNTGGGGEEESGNSSSNKENQQQREEQNDKAQEEDDARVHIRVKSASHTDVLFRAPPPVPFGYIRRLYCERRGLELEHTAFAFLVDGERRDAVIDTKTPEMMYATDELEKGREVEIVAYAIDKRSKENASSSSSALPCTLVAPSSSSTLKKAAGDAEEGSSSNNANAKGGSVTFAAHSSRIVPNDDLDTWLEVECKLSHLAAKLREYGVRNVDELHDLDSADLAELGMKNIEKNRLARALGRRGDPRPEERAVVDRAQSIRRRKSTKWGENLPLLEPDELFELSSKTEWSSVLTDVPPFPEVVHKPSANLLQKQPEEEVHGQERRSEHEAGTATSQGVVKRRSTLGKSPTPRGYHDDEHKPSAPPMV